jgi:hypothetical protein
VANTETAIGTPRAHFGTHRRRGNCPTQAETERNRPPGIVGRWRGVGRLSGQNGAARRLAELSHDEDIHDWSGSSESSTRNVIVRAIRIRTSPRGPELTEHFALQSRP